MKRKEWMSECVITVDVIGSRTRTRFGGCCLSPSHLCVGATAYRVSLRVLGGFTAGNIRLTGQPDNWNEIIELLLNYFLSFSLFF